jgi:hypothetical protein
MSSLPAVIDRPNGKYYGISLESNSIKEINEFKQHSAITFHWESIIQNISTTQNDILIQVAKKMNDVDAQSIKEMASAIEQTKKIAPLDRIFGVKGHYIDRIGFVTSKEIAEEAIVTINIEWVTDDPLAVYTPVFIQEAMIQPLKVRDLRKIESAYGSAIQQAYNRLPAIDDNYERISYQAKMNEAFPIAQISPKEDEGGIISLFYGTNRNPDGTKGDKQLYGADEDTLHTGRCEVSIPQGHTQGQLERPTSFLGLSFPESRNRHVVVTKVQSLEKDAFLSYLESQLPEEPDSWFGISNSGAQPAFSAGHRAAASAGTWKMRQRPEAVPLPLRNF